MRFDSILSDKEIIKMEVLRYEELEMEIITFDRVDLLDDPVMSKEPFPG